MADRWPRASRGSVASPQRPVTDDRWGVARLVAQREAERRAAAADPDPAAGPQQAGPGEPPDAGPRDGRSGPGTTADRPAPGSPAEAADSPAEVPGAVADEEEPEPEGAPSTPAPRPSGPAVPPAPRAPLRPGPPAPPRPLPAPRRPAGRIPGAFDERLTRPRIDPDPDLFGFARHTRGRIGSRVFTLFFVLVFALIVAQTVMSIVAR